VLSFAPTDGFFPNTDAVVAFFNLGEAAVRFGLNPTCSPQIQSLTPSGADGETADALGQLSPVNVTSLTPVPEPGTWSPLAAGLAITALTARRRVSRSYCIPDASVDHPSAGHAGVPAGGAGRPLKGQDIGESDRLPENDVTRLVASQRHRCVHPLIFRRFPA
jgi:hypothetical protein